MLDECIGWVVITVQVGQQAGGDATTIAGTDGEDAGSFPNSLDAIWLRRGATQTNRAPLVREWWTEPGLQR